MVKLICRADLGEVFLTKHRNKEAWIEDILEAAAEVIDRSGYTNLTMEAIAAESGLSKGGIYRFFKNKEDVALALFSRLHMELLDFGVSEVISWNTSLEDTISRLLFVQLEGDKAARVERIWIQLLPETLWSQAFRDEAQRLTRYMRGKYRKLIGKIVERDGVDAAEGFSVRLETALDFGVAVMQGLSIQGSEGMPREERADLLKRFIQVMMEYVLGERA